MSSNTSARTRKLIYEDNLTVLRAMPAESVQLIYLDPPFNSKRAYNVIYPGDVAQEEAFKDTWFWDTACDHHLETLEALEHGRFLHPLFVALDKTQLCAYLVNMAVRLIEMRRILRPDGSIYLHCDPKASHYLKVVMDALFGQKNFQNEIIWTYNSGGGTKKRYGRKHDVLLFYAREKDFFFAPQHEPYASKNPDPARGFHPEGRRLTDVWPITRPANNDPERLGYDTQKPLALLERILTISSQEGDLVLDPFCGSGTTVEAAERLKRQWIGIDITWSSMRAVKERFRRAGWERLWGDITIENKPKTVAEVDEKLHLQAPPDSPLRTRKEFEKFFVSIVGGWPNVKMGADGGIDGKIPLEGGKLANCSVKSGHVTSRHLRELKGTLDDTHVAGVFLSRQEPTKDMRNEVRKAGEIVPETGFLQGQRYPKLQIITLAQALAGKRPILPIAEAKIKTASAGFH